MCSSPSDDHAPEFRLALPGRSAASDQMLVEVRQPRDIRRLRAAASVHDGEQPNQRLGVILDGVQRQAIGKGSGLDVSGESDDGKEDYGDYDKIFHVICLCGLRMKD
jgi:hypothetical protein